MSEGALAVTVDVDGESGLGAAFATHRLTPRSERMYGIARGLPRVLDALAEHRAAATFYVPGITAERHPDEIRAVAERGHEISHHGHMHHRPCDLGAGEQHREIEDGLAALAAVGVMPRGYRAPAWELTTCTLALLAEHGFAYDSSLMGDDRPYLVGSLVELPVHWTLDDAPYFSADPGSDRLARVWTRELDLAVLEDRPLTVTLHPEILGRPHRIDILRAVLGHAAERGIPFTTHAELATRRRPADP